MSTNDPILYSSFPVVAVLTKENMEAIRQIVREEIRAALQEDEMLSFSIARHELTAVIVALSNGIEQCVMADTREDASHVRDRLIALSRKA